MTDEMPASIQSASLIRRIQRLILPVSTVLGTASILIAAFANPPYYGSSTGPAAAIATNAADGDLMDRTHLVAQLIAAYLLPLAFLAMAWLANQRAPWLATIGAVVSLLGFVPLALFVGQDSLYYDIARWGSDPRLVDMAIRFNNDGVMTYYGIAFGLGTVLGPTILGIALWRSRAVPLWAAVCITFSRLPSFVFLAVPYRIAVASVLGGVVLLFIGSIPVAAAILRRGNRDASAEEAASAM